MLGLEHGLKHHFFVHELRLVHELFLGEHFFKEKFLVLVLTVSLALSRKAAKASKAGSLLLGLGNLVLGLFLTIGLCRKAAKASKAGLHGSLLLGLGGFLNLVLGLFLFLDLFFGEAGKGRGDRAVIEVHQHKGLILNLANGSLLAKHNGRDANALRGLTLKRRLLVVSGRRRTLIGIGGVRALGIRTLAGVLGPRGRITVLVGISLGISTRIGGGSGTLVGVGGMGRSLTAPSHSLAHLYSPALMRARRASKEPIRMIARTSAVVRFRPAFLRQAARND